MFVGQQLTAIDRVGAWLKSKPQPFFSLGGWAGTGKTTLARHLAAGLSGRVYFAAYTGKAAHVLMKAGCENVSTIHKLIYQPKERSKIRLRELEAELAQLKRHDPLPENLIAKVQRAMELELQNLSRPNWQLNTDSPLLGAALLVVDEYSMINEQMMSDLLSFGCPILALGDPGQLAPVGGKPFFTGKPDFMLTEIHRQARDNPIIQLASVVREGGRLQPGKYGDSSVHRIGDCSKEAVAEFVLGGDQLLVGKNATRAVSNARYRELVGRSESPYPLAGDKLVCLRNNHQVGLLNGQSWLSCENAEGGDTGSFLALKIKPEGEGGESLDVCAHPEYFNGSTPSPWTMKEAECFDYGYALTVHKSQGSQWPNVTLFDEWYRDDRKNWLYTAITRASEKINIIQM